MWRQSVRLLAAAPRCRTAVLCTGHTLPATLAWASLGPRAASVAARRTFCLGPPPPIFDDFCKGASLLTSAAEFHAVTADQDGKGDMEMIIPPKPVCIAFMSWCSAECRRFGDVFDELTLQHPGVRFYRLDLESEEPAHLALEQGVSAHSQLPVFKLFKNGMEVERVEGAQRDALAAALARLEA